ncbi:MAG TPA: hypothetical protein VEV81_10305 [Pyrinomonadaceae bacterium]|nr:hypothetical protein [Pyrinomonadaceae bacterium]
MPELAPSAQGFLAQLQRQLNPNGESEPVSLSQTNSSGDETTKPLTKEEFYEQRISELEAKADKESNTLFRDTAYIKVALETKAEDYERAKRIVQKIDNNDLRADALSFVLYRAALFFLEKADIERAAELASQITDVLRRSVVRIVIAQRLSSPAPEKSRPEESTLARQRAFDLLVDIGRELKKEGPSVSAARILLARTAVLAKLDEDQALTSLESSIQMINKLEGFDLRDGSAPNLGLGILAASGATVERPRLGFDFRSAIAPLMKTRFEQVAAAPERFTAREIRGVGRLEVAKLYLRMTSDRRPKDSIRTPR